MFTVSLDTTTIGTDVNLVDMEVGTSAKTFRVPGRFVGLRKELMLLSS